MYGGGVWGHRRNRSDTNLKPLIYRPSTAPFWVSIVPPGSLHFWASAAPEFFHRCGSGSCPHSDADLDQASQMGCPKSRSVTLLGTYVFLVTFSVRSSFTVALILFKLSGPRCKMAAETFATLLSNNLNIVLCRCSVVLTYLCIMEDISCFWLWTVFRC